MSRFISVEEFGNGIYKKLAKPSGFEGTKKLDYKENFGNIKINNHNTSFGIRYGSMVGSFFQDTILENGYIYTAPFLCMNMGSDIYMEDSTKNKKIKWDSNTCLNGTQHYGHKSNSIYTKDKPFSIHYILFENKLFEELIKNNNEYINTRTIYKGDYIDVRFNNKINQQQKILLNDLQNITNLDHKLQTLYLESKLLDLTYTSFNSIETFSKPQNIYLSSQDIECLHKAKNILISNMMNPLSLKELAYKSAINEFKLKKGFKQIFGNTVFGLLQEHRLKKAKKLLEEGDVNIGEATTMVGYKSISHFSQIFKKYYGYSPIQIKKNSKTYYI